MNKLLLLHIRKEIIEVQILSLNARRSILIDQMNPEMGMFKSMAIYELARTNGQIAALDLELKDLKEEIIKYE